MTFGINLLAPTQQNGIEEYKIDIQLKLHVPYCLVLMYLPIIGLMSFLLLPF